MFGCVKKVDPVRGYAFIGVDGGADVFANIVENRGVILNYRDEVEFDLIRIKGQIRARARHLKVLDPLRFYKISEDGHGWYKARRGSFTIVYGSSLDEIRQRLIFNPGFFTMSASLKSCDRSPVVEAFYADLD